MGMYDLPIWFTNKNTAFMYIKYTIIPSDSSRDLLIPLNHLKGHLTIPKKVTNNCQVYGIWVGHIPSKKRPPPNFCRFRMFFTFWRRCFSPFGHKWQNLWPSDLKTTSTSKPPQADGDFLLEVKVTQEVQRPNFAPW